MSEAFGKINSDDSLRSSIDIVDAKKALTQSRWSYIGIVLPLIGLVLAIFSFRNLKGLPKIGTLGQTVHKAKFNASIGLIISILLMVFYNGIAFVTYDTAKQNSQNIGQSIPSASSFEKSSSKNVSGVSAVGNNATVSNTTSPNSTSQNNKPTTSNPSPLTTTVPSTVSSSAESIQSINDRYNAQIKAIDDAAKARDEASALYLQCKTDKQNALVSVNQQLADLNTKLIEASSYSSPYLNAYQTDQIRIQKKNEINNQIYAVQAQKNSISTQFSC